MRMRGPKLDFESDAAFIGACLNRGDKNRILRYKVPSFQHSE